MQQECDKTKILIWGEAGVGKTTFCEKISQDWALVVTGREGTEVDKLTEEQRRKLNKIGLLFCIVLRDTNSDQTLEQILTSQFKLLESDLGKLKSNADNVTLILDGFDELSYNEGDIIQIIQGKFNQNIQYIVTCRPYASQGIVLRADSEIRLKGFSESQSKAFIEMFARNRFKKEKDIDLFISRTWKEITSSVDLLEMSTNPSMLQLICILSIETRKIGKDRAEVFKHYTRYLLIQYHTKHCEKVPYSDNLYKDALLKCGKLAMLGLHQNHLQLVFNKQQAIDVSGLIIFDLGFLTEIPSVDPHKIKVQFIHKSLQEYLAAYFVVNTPESDGMKLLMEFCSTSQRLMGSQIILIFIIAMSKRMGKMIQKKIKDYISTWEADDDVDPKIRTSFLISMLRDNRKLTFPLPAVLDIDLQVYDLVSKRTRHFIKSLFGQKSTLERFLNMDGRGIKKINIGVGHYNRLGLLLNNSFTSMEELLINYKNTSSEDDPKHLSKVITTNKPGLISITNCVDLLFTKDIIEKAILTQHVHTVILKKCQISKDNCLLILQGGHYLKSLIIQDCGAEIDAEIAKTVCDLPDETNVDLSGNKIVKMNTKLLASLINKINTQKQIDLGGANIDIDSEMAKAVCDLPDETQIDLSGNKIVKMDKKLLISLIYKIRKQKQIDLSGLNIDIDSEIAKAVCDLPDGTRIVLAGNTSVKIDIKILVALINRVRKGSEVDLSGLYIKVNDREACVVWEIMDKTQTGLNGNKIVEIDIKKFMSMIYKIKTEKELDVSGLNLDIDSEIAKAVCDLPDETQIDLSGNKIVKMDKKLLISLIYKIRKQKQIDLSGLNIDIDSEIAKAVCDLPDGTWIVLAGNTSVKIDIKILIALINRVRKGSEVDLSGLYIKVNDREACVVWEIMDKTQTGLNGNKIVEIDIKKFMSMICKIKTEKELDVSGLNLDIDSEIAKAVCDLPDETQIDLSGNKIVKMDREILVLFINKLKKQKEMDLEMLKVLIDAEVGTAVYDITEKHQINQSDNKPVIMYSEFLIKLVNQIRRDVRPNLQVSMYNIHHNDELVIYVDDMIISWLSTLSEDVQIDLSDNKITDEPLIVSIIKQSTKLKSVTMRNCGIEINKQIAEAVSELNDDTKLDLSGNEITKMEAGLLGKVLKYMKLQEEINFYNWGIIWGITIDVDIVKALSNMVHLKKLDVSLNTLTPSASKCLSESVRSLPQLEVLDLGYCGISNDDCVDLVYSLSKHCPRLEELLLYDNHLSSGYSQVVDDVSKMNNLKELNLGNCDIRNDGCVDLVSSLSKHCPRLRVLYLHYNHLSSGYSQVVDDVSKMNNLRELWLWGNPCMESLDERREIKNRLNISNPQLQLDLYTGY